MQIVTININALTPYENNAKEHPFEQIEQIKRSIEEYGNNDPIGVWGYKNIIKFFNMWTTSPYLIIRYSGSLYS